MVMHCDNQVAQSIANNLVFHERTKHIKVDYHFISKMVKADKIVTPYISPGGQIGDIISTTLLRKSLFLLCNKLDIIDIYTSA